MTIVRDMCWPCSTMMVMRVRRRQQLSHRHPTSSTGTSTCDEGQTQSATEGEEGYGPAQGMLPLPPC